MTRRIIIVVMAMAAIGGTALAATLLSGDGGGSVVVPFQETPEGEDPSQFVGDLPTLLESHRRYDAQGIADLILRLGPQAEEALAAGGFPATVERFLETFDPLALAESGRAALRCTRASTGEDPLAPFFVELAKFRGEPAYVVAFLGAREAVSLFDRLSVWVVHRSKCTPLHVAVQRL